MKNSLVRDLENWHSNEFLIERILPKKIDQDVESVIPILDLLDKYDLHVTFCVLGIFAERHPKLVKYIYDKGYEIQSYSYPHKTLHELSKDAFEEEIKRSVDFLESITGEQPIGFRAPSFSIDNSTKWAFEILTKYGFKYDSSIFELKQCYGESRAPVTIYKPSIYDVTKHGPDGNITEFPITVLKFGTNIPLAGGFYFRILPFWFSRLGIKQINKSRICNDQSSF